jgi:signal transduction histidine kinase
VIALRAARAPSAVAAGLVLALLLGVASFAIVAVAVAAAQPPLLVAAIGAATVGAVVAIDRIWGIAYAVPVALSAFLAFDWYQFPPTHPHALPDLDSLANLVAYLGVSVLIGELAAAAGRRAEAGEHAREELLRELAASRARIAAAADEERRRVVRDIHDGAQQRLVHTLVTLKMARRALDAESVDAGVLVGEALDNVERATAELRELAHGIMPSVLTHGGLPAGIQALAARMPVPVDTEVVVGRLPSEIEATAYFVVAEALTNVAKHAHAARAVVAARIDGGALRLRVSDDGLGGARPDGSGLIGLGDRLAVLEGVLSVESAADGGTLVEASIPLPR